MRYVLAKVARSRHPLLELGSIYRKSSALLRLTTCRRQRCRHWDHRAEDMPCRARCNLADQENGCAMHTYLLESSQYVIPRTLGLLQ
jgi:hypothetical protein